MVNFEEQFNPPERPLPKVKTEEARKSSLQLRAAVELNKQLMIGKVEVFGTENIAAIPKDKKVIIAASHISDIDMPLVIRALGQYFDITVTGQSTNLVKENSGGRASIAAMGRRNYIPIDYGLSKDETTDKEVKKPKTMNPYNFDVMADSLNKGKSVLIAAHNPSSGELPGGAIGASYLSQLGEDFIILPVAVNVKSKEPYQAGKNDLDTALERPDADVLIGKPITPEHLLESELAEYKKILGYRNVGIDLTNEEKRAFVDISRKLKQESDIIMQSIANLLPEEKRGKYTAPPENLNQ